MRIFRVSFVLIFSKLTFFLTARELKRKSMHEISLHFSASPIKPISSSLIVSSSSFLPFNKCDTRVFWLSDWMRYVHRDINNGIKTPLRLSVLFTHFPFVVSFCSCFHIFTFMPLLAIGTTNTVVCGWYILNKHTNVSTDRTFPHAHFCGWRKKERNAEETEQTKDEEEANECRSNLYACALRACECTYGLFGASLHSFHRI